MNFCPDCESVLYDSKKGPFCKSCSTYFSEGDGKFKKEIKNVKKNNYKHVSNNLNNKTKIKKLSKSQLSNSINYIHFFPYEQFRESQENIIRQIEESARSKKNILLLAPNGTGKTIIALSALLPVAIKNDLKIIYMCRTHAQNRRVIKELVKISQFVDMNNLENININGLSIRGRNEMCLNMTLKSLKLNPRESMSVCMDLRKNRNCKHFLNLLKKKNELEKPILIDPEKFKKPIDAEELISICRDKKLCPYFLSKYLLEDMRLIVCNYNWVFNPFISKNFLKFIGKELHNCILVIDECHNIIDIATEINSEKITPYSLKLCLTDLEMYKSSKETRNFVEILIEHLNKKKKGIRSEEISVAPDKLLESLYKKLGFADLNGFINLINDLHDFSVSIQEEKLANGEISRDYLGTLADFWLKWIKSYSLENYFFCYNVKEKKGKKLISLEIVALDPREIAIPILKNCYTCLNLSGTVNPYVFNNLMGFNKSGKSYKGIIAESPFKKKNIKAIITEGVNTRGKNRINSTFIKMNDKINEVLQCTPANVGIFCASYKILKGLLSNGLESIVQKNGKKLFTEKSGLSASENTLLVEDFKSMALNQNNGAVLLGVCGGRNSEGEDYPGDFMNSVIIAGFPYHLPTPRVKAKIEYYDKVFHKQGWNFAYLYPAIERANQASGRPIRRVSDKGAIIFLDSRFKDKNNWISEWIRTEIKIIPDKNNAITQQLNTFWNI